MNKEQEFLLRACAAFDLKASIDHEVTLPSGLRLMAQAHVADLGAPKGMLIFSTFDELSGAAKELVEAGYGYTVYKGALPNEEFDLGSFAEMFADWSGMPLASRSAAGSPPSHE